METDDILTFVLICIPLSLLSFGGGQTIHAGLQQQTVEVQHWLTAREFTDLFAISKSAPGPGTLIAALIGWKIGGLAGAIAGSLAIFVPSSLLICAVGRLWQRHRQTPLVRAIEKGLVPVAVGLILAGAVSIVRLFAPSLVDVIAIIGAMAFLNLTKRGPYTLLLVMACLYLAFDMAGIPT
ncbi:chromate transporter [Paracoccus sp. (in: a-proteobacteria)]|uniref:chromate transporter n=1 Tax=Paracoccus sp. TaxID=267 RepID=UPI00289BAD42|nr:chromate transporter [Paracoccus sp. (in: a-proteobacteria)]